LIVNISNGIDHVAHGWSIIVQNVQQDPVANIDEPTKTVSGAAYGNRAGIDLSAEGSMDPDGVIISYLWTSSIDGDISTSSLDNVKLSPGNHTITLKVTDNEGIIDIDQIEIAVEGMPVNDKKRENTPWSIIIVSLILLILVAAMLVLIILKMKERQSYDAPVKERPVGTDKKERYFPSGKKEEGRIKRESPAEEPVREITVNEKVKCEVCDLDFLSHNNAYICKCASILHHDCAIRDCPNCGADTSRSLESVKVKILGKKDGEVGKRSGRPASKGGWISVESGASQPDGTDLNKNGTRDETSEHPFEWDHIASLSKSNICIHCKKMLRKGNGANMCPKCRKFIHIECADGLKDCPNCMSMKA